MDGLVGLLGFAQTHASPARQAVIFITTATQHKFNFVLHQGNLVKGCYAPP
jgi:hypothetical protein